MYHYITELFSIKKVFILLPYDRENLKIPPYVDVDVNDVDVVDVEVRGDGRGLIGVDVEGREMSGGVRGEGGRS